MERQKRNDLQPKTTSIWSEPNHTFFRFLKRIENRNLPKSVAILGCSDGNYVLPAAKRGFNVFAIDVDRVALYGGSILLGGSDVNVMGLTNRLKVEGLENHVTVVDSDYITYNSRIQFSGVFTSGSIHYQDNSCYPLNQIIGSIQSYVAAGGLLVMEYICLADKNDNPLRHFLTGQELIQYFPPTDWRITSNKKKRYTEGSNPRNNRVHNITWGRLYAEKKFR